MTPTPPNPILAFEASGLAGFVRLDAAGPARFRKEVLRVGRWVHPVSGEALAFDRGLLERLARATNRWIALGHEVWFPAGHTTDPLRNLGRWSAFALEGDRLVAEVEVADEVAAQRVGKTITGVSADIRFHEPASTGELFDAVIVHVAATPCPVIPGQTNFVRLAKEVPVEDDDEKDSDEPKKRTAETLADDPGAALAVIRKILDLPDDADQGSIVEAVRALAADEEESAVGVADTSGTAAYGGIAMAREVERQVRAALAPIQEENRKIRETAARREIELARDATVRAGVPLDKDTTDLAFEQLLGDEKSQRAGRKLLELATNTAKLATRAGLRPLPSPGDESQKKAKVAVALAQKDMLLARGYEVEVDAEGNFTKKIPPRRGK